LGKNWGKLCQSPTIQVKKNIKKKIRVSKKKKTKSGRKILKRRRKKADGGFARGKIVY